MEDGLNWESYGNVLLTDSVSFSWQYSNFDGVGHHLSVRLAGENGIINGRTQAYELHTRLSGLQSSGEYNSSASIHYRHPSMVARFETPDGSGDMDVDNDEDRDGDNDEDRDGDNDEDRDGDNDEDMDGDNDEDMDGDNDEDMDGDNNEDMNVDEDGDVEMPDA